MHHGFEVRRNLLLIGAVLGMGGLCSLARDPSTIDAQSSQSLEKLPKNVIAPEGKTTLFADYEGATNGVIELFIINRTGRTIGIPTQDGDPYIKLEAGLKDGAWGRAQGHNYSGCGNSYVGVALSNECFFRVQGVYPENGDVCKVRYKRLDQLMLVSNEGTGKVAFTDIHACKYDEMAIYHADLKLLQEVLVDDFARSKRAGTDNAIRQLGRFKPDEIEPILKSLYARSDLSKREFEELMRLYQEKLPVRAQALILPVIKDVGANRREWVLKHLTVLDDSILKALLVAVKNPHDPHLGLIMGSLYSFDRPEVRDELKRIINDQRYQEADRLHGEYLLELNFGKPMDIEFKIDTEAFGSNEQRPPYPIKFILTNHRAAAIQFQFGEITEVLGFCVQGYPPVMKPKVGPHWFGPAGKTMPVTKIVMNKGETHEFILNLSDYYDFSTTKKKMVVVWGRCKIPEIHDMPFLSKSGIGIELKQ